jgi:type IV secretion system protein VirD4
MSHLNRMLLAVECYHQRISYLCWFALSACFVALACLMSPVAGAIILLLLLVGSRPKSSQVATAHGTADFADFGDLCQAGCLFQRSGVLLGHAVGMTPPSLAFAAYCLLTFPIRRSWQAVAIASMRGKRPVPIQVRIPDRFPHVAVFASSGGGKSTCYAIPQLLDCSDNMIVLDSKGELCKATAQFRRDQMGHEIVVIDPYGVTEGCGFQRSHFNPLDLFRGNPTRIVDESRRIANALVVKTGKETDQFWPEISVNLITAVLAFLASEARPEEANFNRMRDILSNPEFMEQMLAVMLNSDSCGGLLTRLAGQVMQLQGQTKASAYSVANSHVGFMDSLALADTLASTSFDPQALIHGKVTIYIALPVDRRGELMGVQRVLISSLLNLVFAAGEDPRRRVRYILDESATLGAMDSLYNAVQFGRSFGLRMMFLFQSNSQVERCFPESQKDDFFATVACVYAATNDYRTAKDVSDWMGQSTVMARSEQSGQNWGGSNTNGASTPSQSTNWGGNNSTSYNEIGRSLLRPEEILQLPTFLAIALLPNVRPILTAKVPYFVKTDPGMRRRVSSLLRSGITLAIATAALTFIGWMLTAGADHPKVVHFWKCARAAYTP